MLMMIFSASTSFSKKNAYFQELSEKNNQLEIELKRTNEEKERIIEGLKKNWKTSTKDILIHVENVTISSLR